MSRVLAFGFAAATLVASGSALAQDSDGDGVFDGVDRQPCDASVSGEAFAPADGVHGLLLFEDQWPLAGDRDFNDAVISYNYRYRTNLQGQVVAVVATFNPLALGGVNVNGLDLHLPVLASEVASVTRTIEGGVATALVPSTADTELTVVVVDNLRALFGGQADQINSLSAQAALTGLAVRVTVRFNTPQSLAPGGAPYDVSLHRTLNPRHQIHRVGFSGSANVDQTLFGSGDDASAPGRNYVDSTNLPFVLNVPHATEYPTEAVDISTLFPRIVNFAVTGGSADADYYTSPTLSARYAPATGLRPSPKFLVATAVDRSCLPASRQSCAQILSAGDSTGDGTYQVDLDGAGPMAPRSVQCDMMNGGWTRIVDYNAQRDGNAFATHAAQWTSVDAQMATESSQCCGRYGCNSSSLVYAGNNHSSGLNYDTQFYHLDLSFIGPTQVRFDHHDQVHSWDGALYVQGVRQDGGTTARVLYDNHGCSLDRGGCSGGEVSSTVYNATHYVSDAAGIREFRWGIKPYQGSCGDAHRIFSYAIWFKEAVAAPAYAEQSCKDVLTLNPTTPDGLQWIDTDGAGGNAPRQLLCDMTTNGGGWTRLVDYSAIRDGNAFATHAANWSAVDSRMSNESSLCCGRFGCSSSSVLYAGNNNSNGDTYVTQFYSLDLSGLNAQQVRFDHDDRVESWDGALYVQGDLLGGGSTARVIYDNHSCGLDQGICTGGEVNANVAGTHLVDGQGQILSGFRWGVKHYQGSCGDAHRILGYTAWIR